MTKITFELPDGAEQIIVAEVGESVMQAATLGAVPGIVGECGGEMSCATCHVYVPDDSAFSPISADEDDLLELADGRRESSRLSCQLKIKDNTPDQCMGVPVP